MKTSININSLERQNIVGVVPICYSGVDGGKLNLYRQLN